MGAQRAAFPVLGMLSRLWPCWERCGPACTAGCLQTHGPGQPPLLLAPLQAHAVDVLPGGTGKQARTVWVPCSEGGGYCRVVTATVEEQGVTSVPGEQYRQVVSPVEHPAPGLLPVRPACCVTCFSCCLCNRDRNHPLRPPSVAAGGPAGGPAAPCADRASRSSLVRGPLSAVCPLSCCRLPAGIPGAEAGGCGGGGRGCGGAGAPCWWRQVAGWGQEGQAHWLRQADGGLGVWRAGWGGGRLER